MDVEAGLRNASVLEIRIVSISRIHWFRKPMTNAVATNPTQTPGFHIH